MRYEVEQKYRVTDHSDVRRAAAELGATFVETAQQVDAYYAHPSRDFAATDEALRIRRVNEKNIITYKGPKIDVTTKTRREIELDIAQGEQGAVQANQLLESLSFRLGATVTKERKFFRLQRDGYAIELALDEVEGLGSFVELEVVADCDAEIEPAQRAIAAVAAELGLKDIERRSYLELLLERQ